MGVMIVSYTVIHASPVYALVTRVIGITLSSLFLTKQIGLNHTTHLELTRRIIYSSISSHSYLVSTLTCCSVGDHSLST